MKDYSQPKTLNSLLERFKTVKVRKANTLFPPTYDFSLLRQGKCPCCARPLKLLRIRPLYVCGRKTCPATQDKDPFKINETKLKKIIAESQTRAINKPNFTIPSCQSKNL